MRFTFRLLCVLSLLLILTYSYPRLALGQQQIPFDGLRLVYFTETTQTVQERLGIYASSWVSLLFHDVSASSSKMDIDVNGTLNRNGDKRAEKLNMTVNFPTDRDTLIFLKNAGQDNLTIYAGPSGLAIPSLPGVAVDLTRSWNLHDKPVLRTPVGTFSAIRYHTSIKSITIPSGGSSLDLDFYAAYDLNSQVLVAGEVWATINGASAMIARTELRETNLPSALPTQGPSQCLIATATYGSELAPQVQFLREFRDQKIQKTFAGSNFMLAFNLWYYSFSPAVARAIYASPELRSLMQILLYPLINILQSSVAMFGVFGFQPEMGALLSGLTASAMIGIFYLWIPSILICRRYRRSAKSVLEIMVVMLGTGGIGLLVAEVLTNSLLATVSSAAVVLGNLVVFAALPCMFPGVGGLVRKVPQKFSGL